MNVIKLFWYQQSDGHDVVSLISWSCRGVIQTIIKTDDHVVMSMICPSCPRVVNVMIMSRCRRNNNSDVTSSMSRVYLGSHELITTTWCHRRHEHVLMSPVRRSHRGTAEIMIMMCCDRDHNDDVVSTSWWSCRDVDENDVKQWVGHPWTWEVKTLTVMPSREWADRDDEWRAVSELTVIPNGEWTERDREWCVRWPWC